MASLAAYDYDLREVLEQLEMTEWVNSNMLNTVLVRVNLGRKDALDDWVKMKVGDVQIDKDADTPKNKRVQYGYAPIKDLLDIDIDGRDKRLASYVRKGLEFYGVDARFAFGRASMGVATHFIVKWEGDLEDIQRFPIPALERDGKRLKVELLNANNDGKDTIRKQVVLPGGIYFNEDGSSYDLIRWYGKPNTTMRVSHLRDVIRGVSLGFVLYILEEYWTEGNRQLFAIKLTGWIADLIYKAETNSRGVKNTLSLILPEELTF